MSLLGNSWDAVNVAVFGNVAKQETISKAVSSVDWNVVKCDKLGNERQRSKKVRSWKDYGKWKITAMLHETQVITLWQMEVGNDGW